MKMSNQTDTDIIISLESNDIKIVNISRNVVQERLNSSDQNLLSTLIDRYIQTKSDILLELLIGINEFLVGHLFDKINDYLKHGFTISVCTILFTIVRKQPSWLHKIIGTPLFSTLLKTLKIDHDLEFLMYGILILCSLLPCVPALVGSSINEVLEIFVRTANFIFNKIGIMPEVCALNLRVGVYILFQTLYTMYPNNLLNYLKNDFCGSKKNEPVFNEVIKPMFEFVKFHPDLITDTAKSELGLEKWKGFEPHDVLIQCRKLSLDQIDCIKEATYAVFDSPMESEILTEEQGSMQNLNVFFTNPNTMNIIKKSKEDASESVKGIRNDSLCNPSEICGLTTPPSLTRSCSTQDISYVDSSTRYDSDFRNSNQMLSDVSEKLVRSSTGTFSGPSYHSLANKHSLIKTKSFGSSDTFPHKTLFRSLLLSNSQSTPVDRRHPTYDVTAPESPKRNDSQLKRAPSNELLQLKRDISKPLKFDYVSDNASVKPPSSSPVISLDQSNLSNDNGYCRENDFKPDVDWNAAKEKIKKINLLPCHSLKKDLPVKPTNNTSINKSYDSKVLFKSIKEMFLSIFPNSPKENLFRSSTDPKNNSPLKMLDDFLKYGSDIHSCNLSQVPLTSQLDTDWTYYGGSTPVDELRILQTQVQLLSIQLQYERYKCDLHCLRNRRLFGNLQKCQEDRNEVNIFKDQILLCETKLQEMKIALGVTREENKCLKKLLTQKEEDLRSKICKHEKENDVLDLKFKNHKMKMKDEKLRIASLEKELKVVKYKLFDIKQLYKEAVSKLSRLDHYHLVTDALEKELLIQHDKQENLRHQLSKGAIKMDQQVDLENKIVSIKNELKQLKDKNDVLLLQSESCKLKIDELETSLLKKDSLITELKAYSKKLHSKHKNEINAVENRLQGLVKTCYSLQSYITCLYAKLEEPRTSKGLVGSQAAGGTNLDCIEQCHKVSYGSGLHDHSHRHPFHIGDNPFRVQKSTRLDENSEFS